MVVIVASAVAPPTDCVALYIICMWGWPVAVARTLATSPRQKEKVMSIIRPNELLTMAVQIIARGRVCDASLSSSLMCVAASDPRRENMGASWPTKQDRPILPHPALSWNEPNTSLALLRGPSTHIVMKMAKKPKM
jgi:hypothetical protein